MREVASRAVQAVREVAGEDRPFNELGALLEEFTDVQAADSTWQLLQRLAADWAPSTSKARPAAFKWHALVSLRDELPVADGVTSQRTQDTRALPEEALSPGTLTFMDLGWYLTTVGRHVLTAREVAEAYRLRWRVELLFNALKSGVGLTALRATRPGAVLSLVYAKVIALALSRLLELSLQQKAGESGQEQATGRLALVLALTRCAPLLLSHAMRSRGVTLVQLEERILLIAEVTARSHQQRRERERRKREASLRSGR
ncbi:IS4/IS5 family transposase [Corallococcus terminator]|uniref:IS4/IS5 family transposase n=1 Tax=Corallococcus terminator TaxID=2316733 RepID=A0A3A8J905_9BACT|nr:IS4/IS5 family transposase [Corallococcus terminator]